MRDLAASPGTAVPIGAPRPARVRFRDGILGSALLLLIPAAARATNLHYVGPDGGNWNNAANWSTTAGGAGGAGVPGVGDRAIVDPATTRAITFDADYVTPGLLQIYLDGQSGATVTLNQGSHAAVSTVESIGVQGIGIYHQTGGSNMTTGDFHVGQSGGGTGTYQLDGGTLTVGASEYIGEISSIGNFTENGGTHTVGDALKVAYWAASTGHFTLNNGSVTVNGSGYLTIGQSGIGTFTQTGGAVTADHLQLAQGTAGNATYDLQSGTLDVNGSEAIGAGGTGVFTQTGGTHTMTGNLYLTLDAGSSGTYNLNGGTLNVTGNILNNGTMTQAPAATLNLGGTIIGNGIIQTNGPVDLANQTNINSGTLQVGGGTTSALTLIVGKDAVNPDPPNNTISGNGALTILGGTTNVDGVLGVGNDGTLTAGAGNGSVTVTGGTLNAKTVILGSTAGGTGTMRVGGIAQIVIGGGLSANDLIMDGGSLTVLDQAPPAGEDPMLDRSMVGGYLRDGAIQVHGGTVTSPKVKLGVTSGKTGTMNMDGGTMTVGILGAGNDATLTGGTGIGNVTVTGGTLNAATIMLGSSAGGVGRLRVGGIAQIVIGGGLSANDLIMDGGSLTVLDQPPPPGEDPVLDRSIVGGYLHDGAVIMNAGSASTPNLKMGVTPGKVGTLTMNGGSLEAANFLATNGAGSVIAFNGGTLRSGHSDVAKGSALVVGDGARAARLALDPPGGTHTFADGLAVAANARLSGAGTIVANVTNSGALSPGNNAGDVAVIAVNGSYTQTSSATLQVDLRASASGNASEALRATGPVTLGGTLETRIVAANPPAMGQDFVVAVGHPLTGTFALVEGSGVTVVYDDTSAVATFNNTAVPLPPAAGVAALALRPIQPNPLRGEATIVFDLPVAGPASVAVLDASGRMVRGIARSDFGAGRHTLRWDGRDESGESMRAGVYLVRLTAMGRNLSQKLILIP